MRYVFPTVLKGYLNGSCLQAIFVLLRDVWDGDDVILIRAHGVECGYSVTYRLRLSVIIPCLKK